MIGSRRPLFFIMILALTAGFFSSMASRAQPPVTAPQPPVTAPQAPVESPQPPTAPQPPTLGPGSDAPKSPGDPSLLNLISPARQQITAGGQAEIAQGGSQTQIFNTSDAGDFLNKSSSLTGVESAKRTPIVTDTRIRGYHLGELVTVADGAFWFPARQDLDSFFSKIDSGSIRDAIVIKGPYTARYGPGFSFIDIETYGAPRSTGDGLELHGRSLFNYKTNAQQIYGRQDISVADTNWGVFASYGQRIGNNYETGSDLTMESRYNTRDINFAIGADLTSWAHLEFAYMRLDQTGVEFPGQVFDTRFLITDAYRTRLVVEEQDWFDRFTAEGWYNNTALKGNNQGSDKRIQIPELNALNFVGLTDIGQSSAGARAAMTWGKPKAPQLTIGTDLRFLGLNLNEFDSFFGLSIPCANLFNFPVPKSGQYVIGGAFIEYSHPIEDKLTFKVGGRGDYVYSNAAHDAPGFPSCAAFEAFAGSPNVLGTTDFQKEESLWMAYGTAEYKVTDHWTLSSAVGHAERPPTLTELYATGPFLAILQQGFTSVIGNPNLAPERLWQTDLGASVHYDRFRAGGNVFFSWVQDYITYEAVGSAKQNGLSLPSNLTNALTVRFVNTDLATLAGYEAYADFDATPWLTPFVTTSFVDATDQTRDHRGFIPGGNREPLPGITPMETRMGLRFHDSAQSPKYGVEIAARMDDKQSRVAASLLEQTSAGFVVYDVRGYWQARKWLLLTAGVENLFNRNYRESLDLLTGIGVYQPGISGYFGVEMKY